MARYHTYIEANTGGKYVEGSGTYISVSDKVPQASSGDIKFNLKGRFGQAVLSPPSSIQADNHDGWWIDQPSVSGGDFEGHWEGRRVKLTLETGGQDEVVLGVFRIAHEEGVTVHRNGKVAIRLEAMAASLQRADASEVKSGKGWHQQIPWPLAFRKVLEPEVDTSSVTLPNCPFQYEEEETGISALGRPGDFEDDEFYEINELAMDVCWNSEDNVFCFATHSGLYEWDPTTGQYDAVTLSFTLTSGHDILRVWFHDYSGSGWYLVLSAPRNVATQSDANGSGYYQPLDQAYRYVIGVTLWAHDSASALKVFTEKICLAPVVWRDCTDARAAIDQYQVGQERNQGGGLGYTSENIIIPYSQFPLVLFTRRTEAGEVPGTGTDIDQVWIRWTFGDPIGGDPLWAYAAGWPTNQNDWDEYERTAADAREEWNDNWARKGAGYYQYHVELSANVDLSGTNRFAGARLSWGSGPMVDVSWNAGGGHNKYNLWFVFVDWDGTDQFRIRTWTKHNSGDGLDLVQALDAQEAPTFVYIQVKENEAWSGGTVIWGWVHFDPDDATFDIASGGDILTSSRPTQSGIGCRFIATATTTGTLTWQTAQPRLLTLTSEADTLWSPEGNRYYWTTVPSGGTPRGVLKHVSGRWVPVAMGAVFIRMDSGEVYMAITMSCLDRSECVVQPYGYPVQRKGMPFRLLAFYMLVDSSGYEILYPDSYGDGHAVEEWSSALPLMGFTKTYHGSWSDWGSGPSAIFFYCAGDGNLYKLDSGSGAPGGFRQPKLMARNFISDQFLGIGTLAVDDATATYPQIAGVSSPVFPLSDYSRWPGGLYYAWLYSTVHGGRIPLLDLKDMMKWDAAGAIAQISDSHFFFKRDGTPDIQNFPDSSASADISLTPSDYADASRVTMPPVNYATMSPYDVQQGEYTKQIILTEHSEWNLDVDFSGMGVYSANLELICISGGRVSDGPRHADLNRLYGVGAVNFGWREDGNTIQARVASTSSGTTLYLDQLADLEVGDFVTLGPDAQDIAITAINEGTGAVTLESSMVDIYYAGDPVWIVKRAFGRWTHESTWNEDTGTMEGITALAEAASSGDFKISVNSLQPFSVGCHFTIHDESGAVDYSSIGTLQVTRILNRRDTGADYHQVEFRRVDSYFVDEGLSMAVNTGDQITTWLNIDPANRSVIVGQTGIRFTINGAAAPGSQVHADGDGQDIVTNTRHEKPISEGDRVKLSYAGLEGKKNQHSKVTSRDLDHIRDNGVKKAARIQPNKFMDYHLANMHVNRLVTRGVQGLLRVTLNGVFKWDSASVNTHSLEPLAVIQLTDDVLLYDRVGYTSKFALVEHTFHKQSMKSTLVLEELPAQVQARVGAAAGWTPASLSNLEAWFTSKSLAQLGAVAGNDITFWPDLSGNGNHAYSDAGNDPTLAIDSGLPVVAFASASNQRLKIGDAEMHDNSRGMTIIVVGKGSALSPNDAFISKYNTNFPGYRQWFFRVYYATVQEVATAYDPNTVCDPKGDGNWRWTMMQWDAAGSGSVKGYRDGVLQDTAPSTVTDVTDTAAHVYIGGERTGFDNNLNGSIAEIIVVSGVPTSEELTDLAAYIESEYDALLA